MKNYFTKTHLFSCPIYKIKIDPNSYDKEKILKDIKYNKSLKNTRNEVHQTIGIPHDIHHSHKDFDNVNFRPINYEKLSALYLKIFKEFLNKEIYTTKKLFFEFEIVNYSAVTEGQYLPSHNHMTDADFATIHYLNFKDDHTPTYFNNPADWAPYLHLVRPELQNILNSSASDNSYLLQQFRFPVKEDDMIIWPAALNHSIFPHGPIKEPRITISSNLKISLKEVT